MVRRIGVLGASLTMEPAPISSKPTNISNNTSATCSSFPAIAKLREMQERKKQKEKENNNKQVAAEKAPSFSPVKKEDFFCQKKKKIVEGVKQFPKPWEIKAQADAERKRKEMVRKREEEAQMRMQKIKDEIDFIKSKEDAELAAEKKMMEEQQGSAKTEISTPVTVNEEENSNIPNLIISESTEPVVPMEPIEQKEEKLDEENQEEDNSEKEGIDESLHVVDDLPGLGHPSSDDDSGSDQVGPLEEHEDDARELGKRVVDEMNVSFRMLGIVPFDEPDVPFDELPFDEAAPPPPPPMSPGLPPPPPPPPMSPPPGMSVSQEALYHSSEPPRRPTLEATPCGKLRKQPSKRGLTRNTSNRVPEMRRRANKIDLMFEEDTNRMKQEKKSQNKQAAKAHKTPDIKLYRKKSSGADSVTSDSSSENPAKPPFQAAKANILSNLTPVSEKRAAISRSQSMPPDPLLLSDPSGPFKGVAPPVLKSTQSLPLAPFDGKEDVLDAVEKETAPDNVEAQKEEQRQKELNEKAEEAKLEKQRQNEEREKAAKKKKDKKLEEERQRLEQHKAKLDQAKDHFDKGYDLCWNKQDKSDAALIEYRKALFIRESLLGKYHEDTGRTYFWIGRSLVKLKEYDEALMAFSRALRIFERVLMKSHKYHKWALLAIESVYSELKVIGCEDYKTSLQQSINHERAGDSFRKKGQNGQAIAEYRMAIEKLEDSHPDAADLYVKVAMILRKQGEFDRALEEYRYASEIYELSLGADHPETVKTLNQLIEKKRSSQLALALMEKLKIGQ